MQLTHTKSIIRNPRCQVKLHFRILCVLLLLTVIVSTSVAVPDHNIDALQVDANLTNANDIEVKDYNATAADISDFADKLAELFTPTKPQNDFKGEQVYLGGYPLGITIDGNGVKVIGLNEFISDNGKVVCPAIESGIRINDTVVEIDGIVIHNSVKLSEIANASEGKSISIKYIRQGQTYNTTIVPQRDLSTGMYRLGLWTRDSSSGVGTLTYIKKDLQFGSLGHPIFDNEGKMVPVTEGSVFQCKINGVVKGQKGSAGELKGSFDFNDKIGSVYLNNKFGVYGNFSRLPDYQPMQLIDVAAVSEVKQGKAYVYCTLEGAQRDCYEIEIVKAVNQTSKEDKGMVLRVTDPRLLDKTGGIVQGMSGSPIVQNGKLVGAVTHVFINDPTKGYGVYAQWMLDN